MKLIPTRKKIKLPKGYSYPVGAKEISEALAKIPQYDSISIIFRARDTYSASKHKEKIRDQKTLTIIEAEYNNPQVNISSSNKMIESGYYDSRWILMVYALPKDFRHTANLTLKTEVLPKLKKWLNNIGIIEESDSSGYRIKSFGFDLETGEIKEI